MDEFPRTATVCPATLALLMLTGAPLDVCGKSDVETTVGVLQNVNEVQIYP